MKQWYGVRTFPGYEQKVKSGIEKLIEKNDLQEQVTDIFFPTYKKYTFVRKDIKLKEELIFPGYVFVKMNLTNENMYSVRGVQYIVGYAGTNELKKKPDPITDDEINKMIKTSEQLLTDLEVGQEVAVDNYGEKEPAKIQEINLEEEVIITTDGKKVPFVDVKKS